MEKESIRMGRWFRRGTKAYLNDIPNVSSALTEFNANPGEFNARVKEFTTVLVAFNMTTCLESNLGAEYLNVLQYRRAMGRYPVPMPQSILSDHNRYFLHIAAETLVDINLKTKKGEWKFPTEVKDPKVLTSALLIEGYGLFLERLYDAPGLARNFVLGFEEVLWNKFKKSRFLKDVLPWMIEERDAFSPKMSQELQTSN